MSDLLALTGRYANLARLGTSITASSAHALYPAANAIDNNPSKPWRAGSTVTPQYLILDMNHRQNDNGSFEDWALGAPVGWTVVTEDVGVVTQETDPANVHTGASAVRFGRGHNTGVSLAYKDFEVPSGTLWRLSMFVKAGLATNRIWVQNLDTGQWLLPPSPWLPLLPPIGAIGEGWGPAIIPYWGFKASSLDPTVYVHEIPHVFRVEDWWEPAGNAKGRLSTRKDVTTIRVMIGWDDGVDIGNFYLDDLTLVPALDFASVHHHNLRGRDRLALEYSADGIIFGQLADFDFGGVANRKQDVYVTFDAVVRQYIRLRAEAPDGLHIDGSFDQGAPQVSELVLGQARTLAMHESYGHATGHRWPQHRDEAGIYAYAQADQPTRSRNLILEPRGDAETSEELADVLIRLYQRSRAGAFPAVIVPDNTQSEVFFGRFPPDLDLTRDYFLVHKAGLTLRGFPAPVPL